MERHFTATVYIVHEDRERVLLIYHRKLQKWLAPGGHLDANELPSQAAIREAREETGLEIELVSQETVWVQQANSRSFERPSLCLLHEVPPYGNQPAHQHMDFIYVGRVLGGQENENKTEVEKMRWFSISELETLPETELFQETLQVIKSILQPQLMY